MGSLASSLHQPRLMRISSLCHLLVFLFLGLSAPAGAHWTPGYISDVQSEKTERFYEIYLLAPNRQSGPSLRDIIFNPLSREFKEKYRDKFGDLDTSSISYRNSTWGGTSLNPKTLEEENLKRREFAEYMTKRLTEYHVDNYMKTQPQMRPVMQVKEKIQNVKVEVSKEVRMNIQYNFAGNTADVVLDNPWCESRFTVEMNPRSFGPSNPQEFRLWLAKKLDGQVKLNSNIAVTDGIAYADVTRGFSKYHLAATIGLSAAFKDSGTSARETKYILGFTHSY